MSKGRKIFYVVFTGMLTSMAMSACYWQTSKYFMSKQKWRVIARQLSQQHNPPNISQLSESQKQNLYAFKYLQIEGSISPEYVIIQRSRGMRTGYLVLRKITYTDNHGQLKQMIALQGWCPQSHDIKINTNEQTQKKKHVRLKGILRKKQTTDYLHKKMKASDLQKYKMNTWINLQKYLVQFNIKNDDINTNFYFQILKPTLSSQQQEEQYPYQYSVDNFQLPYLTPQKHQGYAAFWGCTSLVGWFAIVKAIRMK